MSGMATHASMVEQGQGEHDVLYSISGIYYWYCGYALRPPSRWVGRCARQTRRNVNNKGTQTPSLREQRGSQPSQHAKQRDSELNSFFSNLLLLATSRTDEKDEWLATRASGSAILVA